MDEELLERVVDSILFRSALSLLRRGYNSTTGLGSQNQEIYLHTILADFINRYARKKVEEYREENSTDKTTEKELLTETLFWF